MLLPGNRDFSNHIFSFWTLVSPLFKILEICKIVICGASRDEQFAGSNVKIGPGGFEDIHNYRKTVPLPPVAVPDRYSKSRRTKVSDFYLYYPTALVLKFEILKS